MPYETPLPQSFVDRIAEQLPDDHAAFLAAMDSVPTRGLRCNLLKVRPEELRQLMGNLGERVAWTSDGFYVGQDLRPGRDPLHAAGLYYMQEPSAMAVGEAIEVKPGERVLDLCAAPGGKATKIGAMLAGTGVLVANDITVQRARILSENIERCGITNAIVTAETPHRLAERFRGYFDAVVVDAPCSGEGMFRKDDQARQEWSDRHVVTCSHRQKEILAEALKMIRPGGRLLYSTCTFSTMEDEDIVDWMLRQYPMLTLDFISEAVRNHVVTREPIFERAEGHDAVAVRVAERTLRLWPHLVKGEGHFLALFRHQGSADDESDSYAASAGAKRSSRTVRKSGKGKPILSSRARDALTPWCNRLRDEVMEAHGERLYVPVPGLPSLDGLALISPGWHVGHIRGDRIEPSHGLALGLRNPNDVPQRVNLDPSDPLTEAFMRGEAIPGQGSSGWVLITVAGYSLGFAKRSDGWLKNHLPKVFRIRT